MLWFKRELFSNQNRSQLTRKAVDSKNIKISLIVVEWTTNGLLLQDFKKRIDLIQVGNGKTVPREC